VEVPRTLPRWIPLALPHAFVPLESLIGDHLEALFPGQQVLDWHAFRITRNTDLNLADAGEPEDAAAGLLELVAEEVKNRRFGEVVRLEVQASMPPAMRTRLMEKLNEADAGEGLPLTEADVFAVPGPLAVGDLRHLATLELPALRDPPFEPVIPPRLAEDEDILATIRDGAILLHHPYDSFAGSVEQFITRASEDPDVIAIKMTLYRTGGAIAELLALAAERGKQVSVLIELQARFDEENNIAWAKRFEDVGVQVSYGVNGMKTHAKVILIERMEGTAVRRYVHVGTGNYNPGTAGLYTDFGLLSADPDLGADVSDLFDVLPTAAAPASYRKLLVAPHWMKRTILERIQREAAHAHRGERARIIAKMNALVDAEVIAALYEASRAGVEVDLIVRGICCLRPGVPGVSDRIRVISILGRFLEHSRAFLFQNAGEEECYITSADWMPRNLLRRVETAVPLEDAGHRATLRQCMETMLQDNRQAWDLGSDGRYSQRTPAPGEPERGSQRVLAEARR
jgi:polyphosphate kinase